MNDTAGFDTDGEVEQRNFLKGRSVKRILLIAQRVIEIRQVDSEILFSQQASSAKGVSPRCLAMAACVATGIPLCHVAKAFNLPWATVYEAEAQCLTRFRRSKAFREQWCSVVQDDETLPMREWSRK